MLREQPARSPDGGLSRRWFADDFFDLYVWSDASGAIVGFQLCYGKPDAEHALDWTPDGFSHHAVDPGEDDPRDPLASPLYGDLAGLPPLFVTVGGDEALLDDAVRLVRKAGMAGVDSTLLVGGDMQHIFPVYAGYLPEANAAVAVVGEWVRAHVAI